jgi:pimeloyl-ACP methyl ester carboxylesterase
MRALKVERAHISGLSLGAAVGMWLAAKYPQQVKSLSLHDGWTKTDLFVKTVVEGWQVMVRGTRSVTETVIQGIFPWCFTPGLYVAKPDYVESLAAFVRGRPAQPVDAFMRQSNAVIAHDVEPHLGKITAPTQVTCGRYDMLTGLRFAERMKAKIRRAELIVFEGCAHAPIYEKVDEFNQRTIAFLKQHSG